MKKVVLIFLCLTICLSMISCNTGNETDPEPTYSVPEYDVPSVEYTEYETTNYKEASTESVTIRVEGEKFKKKTIANYTVKGSEFSNGKILACTVVDENWSKDYYVTYSVTVPSTGNYSFSGVFGELKREWTNDFFVYVNGEKVMDAGESFVLVEDFNATFDPSLMKVCEFGSLLLQEGENEIKFLLDPDDPRDDNWIVFFVDYFELSYDANKPSDLIITYDYSLDENYAETLSAASNVNVFDSTYPLKITMDSLSSKDRKAVYIVRDYFGETVYRGTVELKAGETIFEKGIENHPTGYFTLDFNGSSLSYVVTPPIYTRISDSPFAMDFASCYLIEDVDDVYNVACAAKVSGVTWVRERANWSDYEPAEGSYDFSSTDEKFKAINKAELNLLSMICNAPSWAISENYPTSSNILGGFRDTRLSVYNFAKEMAKHYDGIVDAFEFWNEMDHTFSAESAELYSSWYKSAALGIADSGTSALTTYGGLCLSLIRDYDSILMANGVTGYSDMCNYHQHVSYTESIIDFSSLKEVVNNQSLAEEYAKDDPVWVTEAGMKLSLNNDGTAIKLGLTRQAKYLVTSTTESLANGTDKHFWFVLSPYVEEGGDFGTFSEDLEPYPSLAAESVMTYMLGEGKYIGTLSDLPSDSEKGILFDTGYGKVAVVWTSSGEETSYTFDSEGDVVVTDIMGGNKTYSPENGKITITLTDSPIYISYNASPKYNKSKTSVVTATAKRDYSVGDRVILTPMLNNGDSWDDVKENGYQIEDGEKIKVVVTNFNDFEVTGSISGTLKNCTIDGVKDIKVPANSEVTVEITIHIKKEFDDYLTITGKFNGEETSPAVVHLYKSKK